MLPPVDRYRAALSRDAFLDANRANWDERTALHLSAYDTHKVLDGGITLHPLELGEVGPVEGRTLLHLQCHFGLDTLSWARLGAEVTGVDFSEAAIDAANALVTKTDLEARFVCAGIDDPPRVLDGRFDVVLATYGVLPWIPDVARWAAVAAHFLRDGGTFYLADGHPVAHMLDDNGTGREPGVRYFHDELPYEAVKHGSYVGEERPFAHPESYQWQHSIGEILAALDGAGIGVEFLHEWPFVVYQPFPGMVRDDQGYWHVTGDPWPLLLSIRGTRRARTGT
ncbi:MAG: class I SAM-dependent methyltransferase [Chloroflexi bacterium]|nr:class I SAM-dependent methyltransferase [Chloroflexota bacterium]